MYSTPRQALEQCRATLQQSGFDVLATVMTPNETIDVAASLHHAHFLFRLVKQITDEDEAALAAILADGDAHTAFVIHCDKDQSALRPEVETCWIGDIERLAQRLAAEARPA
jgi:hypothetical protein